ncbi:hypothetical protein CNMCM6106_001396 [Aspergillus hiratsukae]|uniref:Uncharacterized protein n=1 Tax=Aspergillus hiratsukae TaxID=1194566 RepID=A0A8H6Q425_9EURO|nr:hypothetical protein CNMCM6106_001396 [Aspergillus hiratsukae]
MSGKGLNLKTIQSEILKCPRELNGLYEELLGKIEDNELLEASKLFQWICFARWPLSLSELKTAMTVHLSGTKSSLGEYENEDNPNYILNERKMQKRMIYLSRGLADITSSNSGEGKALVGFFHESINEFMRTKGLQYLNRRLIDSGSLAGIGHFQLANACLDYLSTEEIRIAFLVKRLSIPTQFNFLEYAAMYWLDHALEAEKEGFGVNVKWPLQRTIDTYVRIRKVLEKHSPQCPKEGTTLMHIAAEHGLQRLAKTICIQSQREAPAGLETKDRLYGYMNSISTRPSKNILKDNRKQNMDLMPNTLRRNQQRTKKEYGTKQNSGRFVKDTTMGSAPKTTRCVQRVVRGQEKRSNTGLDAVIANNQRDMRNARNNAGESPLYVAARCGHLGMVRFLLRLDGELTIKNRNGSTPSHRASVNANFEVVKFRYEREADADIHTADNDGCTPLYSASRYGHLEVVKFLYECGADADIHTATKDGWTPINAASDSGHLEVVKFLYECGADTDIHTAANDGWTPINAASSKGHLEVVKFLYERGADTDIHTATNDGRTPLHSASNNGHLAVVKFLLEKGADPTVAENDGQTPLHAACCYGYLKIVDLILNVAITTATLAGHIQRTIEILNKQDVLKRTPLCLAVHGGHEQVIRRLVDSHADVSLVDCYGRSVADWALLFSADYLLRDHCHDDLRPTTVEEQQKVLCQTVQFICEMNIQSATMSYLDELGRCLLFHDDVPSALKVFEQSGMATPATTDKAVSGRPPATATPSPVRPQSSKASTYTMLTVMLMPLTNIVIVVLLGLLVGKLFKVYSILDHEHVYVHASIVNDNISPISVYVANTGYEPVPVTMYR